MRYSNALSSLLILSLVSVSTLSRSAELNLSGKYAKALKIAVAEFQWLKWIDLEDYNLSMWDKVINGERKIYVSFFDRKCGENSCLQDGLKKSYGVIIDYESLKVLYSDYER